MLGHSAHQRFTKAFRILSFQCSVKLAIAEFIWRMLMETITLHCKRLNILTVCGDTSSFQATTTKHAHIKLKEKHVYLLFDSLKVRGLPKPASEGILYGPDCCGWQAQNELLHEVIQPVGRSEPITRILI